MPLDYSLQSSLFRVKTKVDGAWVDDPDVKDPAVELPEQLLADDPTTRLAWRMQYRSGTKVKYKVTFRQADGVEVAGTYDVYAFIVVPLCDEEKALGAARPAIETNPPALAAGTSEEPNVIDDLGMNDAFGLIFSNISAGAATHMFVRIEEI